MKVYKNGNKKTNQYIGVLLTDAELENILFEVLEVEKHPCLITHNNPKYRYAKFGIASTSSVLMASTSDTSSNRLEDMTKNYFGFVINIEDPDSILGKLVKIERRIAKNESTYFTLYEAACSLANTPKAVKP